MTLLLLACADPVKEPADTQVPSHSEVDSVEDSPQDSPVDTSPVDEDGDGWFAKDDCDDQDPSVNPGMSEVCGGGDEDCDGAVDEQGALGEGTWYSDLDGDGWGEVEKKACDPPPQSTETPGDCNDQDPEIHPGAGCDWVLMVHGPGTAQLFLVSPSGADITDGIGIWTFAASSDAVELSLGSETRIFRSELPFVAHVAYANDGGDMVTTALSGRGRPRGDDLTLWAGEHVQVFNPNASDVVVGVERWDGSAWATVGSATVAPASFQVFSGSRGLYRVRGTADLLASGWMVHNVENHFETVPSVDGTWVGESFIWQAPEVMGQVGVVGTCLELAGCSVSSNLGGTQTLSYLQRFRQRLSAGTPFTLSSQGDLLLRDETTPYGWDGGDGTCMDTDLAVTVEGARYGSEFIVPTSEGMASSYPNRRMDLVALVYVDGTTMALERWDGGAWVSEASFSADAGETVQLVVDEPSGALLRVAATEDIHLQLEHTSSEFAFSTYSDHYADR